MRDERTRALQKEATARWRMANPEKVREKKRRAHARMTPEKREKERERLRKWARDNREKERRRGWAKQGLPEPTRQMPQACELCGHVPAPGERQLALDHDHDTNKFRGWLCWQCNTGLGLLGDTLVGLMKAVQYVVRNTHGDESN